MPKSSHVSTTEKDAHNERFAGIVNAARDAIICADSKGKIVYTNGALQDLFGYTSEELSGADLTILMPEACRAEHTSGFNHFIEKGAGKFIGRIVEMLAVKKDGDEFPIELGLATHTVEGGLEMVGIIRDITAAKDLLKRLEVQAETDGLTRLKNRHVFDSKLEEEVRRARRYGKNLSLVVADLDHFKQYNDCYGHQAGDTALKAVSKTFQALARTTDTVARYGGEEIAAILPETGLAEGAVLADRIMWAVRNLDFESSPDANCPPVTVSIGVAELAHYDKSGADLLSRADTAMYEAKSNGRNRVSVYPSGPPAGAENKEFPEFASRPDV